MKITRTLALGLAVLMLSGSMISCSKKADNDMINTTDTEAVTTSAPLTEKTTDSIGTFEKGHTEDKVYINEFADLKLNIPKNWNLYTDSDLAKFNNLEYDISKPEEYENKLKTAANIFDFMAFDAGGNCSILVLFQDPGQLGITDSDPEKFLESQINELRMENARTEGGKVETKEYFGHSYATASVNIDPESGEKLIQDYYIREAKGYLLTIMVTSYADDRMVPGELFA